MAQVNIQAIGNPNNNGGTPAIVTHAAGHSPGGLLYVNADSDVVLATPFLCWEPVPAAAGQPTQVQTTQVQCCAVFLPPMAPSTAPGAQVARDVSALELLFTGGFWTQVFNEMSVSGLFFSTSRTYQEFLRRLSATTFSNPNNLIFDTNDLLPAQPFTIPPAIAANASQAAQARRRLLMSLVYLSMSTVGGWVESTALPLLAFSRLISMIGPCRTQHAREDERAAVHLVTELIKAKFSDYPSDPLLAQHLEDIIRQVQLPIEFHSQNINPEMMLRDALDGFSYYAGGSRRANVERRRIFSLVSLVRAPYTLRFAHTHILACSPFILPFW